MEYRRPHQVAFHVGLSFITLDDPNGVPRGQNTLVQPNFRIAPQASIPHDNETFVVNMGHVTTGAARSKSNAEPERRYRRSIRRATQNVLERQNVC